MSESSPPVPDTSYAVVAEPAHVEAMARAVSGMRWFGPLPWFLVLAGAWGGFALSLAYLPEALRVRPLLGWPVVAVGAVLAARLSAQLGSWAIRRKMRELLVARGWGEGTEHTSAHGQGWFALSGPSSQVRVEAADVRRVHARDGAVVVVTTEDGPVLSVAELFPAEEVERLRLAAPDARSGTRI